MPAQPGDNVELKASGSPSIQDVIRTSQVSIKEINSLTRKIETLVDSLNSKRGTVGALINDHELAQKITTIATNLETITGAVANGKGSLGKFVNDDTLYNRANSAVDRLDKITTALDEGKGSAGKLLKDDTLYNNLNAAVANTNQMLAEINAGKGAMGKIARDPVFAEKLGDTVARLDSILKSVDEGKGSLGQLHEGILRALSSQAENDRSKPCNCPDISAGVRMVCGRRFLLWASAAAELDCRCSNGGSMRAGYPLLLALIRQCDLVLRASDRAVD